MANIGWDYLLQVNTREIIGGFLRLSEKSLRSKWLQTFHRSINLSGSRNMLSLGWYETCMKVRSIQMPRLFDSTLEAPSSPTIGKYVWKRAR